jgi:outer membrane receptor protein involved in Fe transport
MNAENTNFAYLTSISIHFMKKWAILLVAFFSISASIRAQFPGGGRQGGGNMSMGRFYGKITESKTNKGVDAASVQLIQSKFDTISRKRKDTVISGMLTKSNGDFSLENLPLFGNFKLVITAIGFKTIEQKVAFQLKAPQGGDFSQALSAVDKDLGNIKMEIDSKVLEGVTVTGNRNLVQMGIDRKVFNVEKNLVSAGGTAVDIMKSVPSLQVDIDGNVTLRNNSPQIFVDGRPSTLTLDQIPADAVQSVEIITNPSAKFDASGGTSGILNVVLKKNRKTGYNGSIRTGIDSRGRFNVGGDFNVKEGKINTFLSGNYGQRKSIATSNTSRTTFLNNPSTLLTQNDKNTSIGAFAFIRGGLDYFIDNRNTITFSGTLVRGQFKPLSESDIFVDTLFTPKTTSFSDRNSKSKNSFRNNGGAISYKHNFSKAGKEITADINYNASTNTNENTISTDVYRISGGPLSGKFTQQQNGGGNNESFTAQTDYSNPLSDKSKIEMGARMAIRNIDSRNDFAFITPTGQAIPQPLLSSKYKNSDKVYAVYSTYSNRIKDFGYQLGLRAESSVYEGTLFTVGKQRPDTAISFGNEFPLSFFPSVFLSQKFKKDQEMQLNYTRRINRPNFFQLFPFTDFSDSLNLSRGNPGLKPEFTNSFEISYQKTFKGNNSLLASVYYKNTNDLITRFQVKESNPIKISDTVLINTYINANRSYVTGLEVTSRNTLTKWWEISTNVNFFTSKIKINDPTVPPQERFFSWFAKMNHTFKLPSNFTFQLTGEYTSKTILPPGGSGGNSVGGGGGGGFGGGGRGGGGFGQTQTTAQGFVRPNYGVDAALRFEFLKNKAASLSLSMNDIFRSRRNDVFSQSAFFVQNSFRRRDPQILRLNFNWRFGKFDASLFKRKNIRGGMEGLQDSQIQQ